MPTQSYYRAIAEAEQHHGSSKTYSGKFLRPHAPFIKEIIDRLGCKSVLDYGCGKGKQYEWRSTDDSQAVPKGQTIEEYWGLEVRKYDPAYPPLAQVPTGRFDLVICTHVVGSVPRADLRWFREGLERYALKAIYYAEKIGPVGKQVFSEPHLMPRDWTRAEWAKALQAPNRPGLEVWLATREDRNGEIITERSII
jgi:SAM-dependent methyltransferase